MGEEAIKIDEAAQAESAENRADRREALKLQLEQAPAEQVPALLESFAPPEIAETLEDCSLEDQLKVLRAISPDEGVEIFESLEPENQAELLPLFKPQRVEHFLNEMSPDERADLLGEVSAEEVEPLLELMSEEEREDARLLMGFGDTTAGGLMTTDFAALSPDDTVASAIEKVRERYNDFEMLYYLYVVDDAEKLVGLVTLRYLITSPGGSRIRDIMQTKMISLGPEEDQEAVARELTLYDFYAMPIVDTDGRMLGIVTFDDVADVLEEEAVEDQELFGGMIPSEHDYIDQTLWEGVKQRFPWLALFLVLSSGSGFVIIAFRDAGYYSQPFFGLVIALLPMITAMAGNAATQSATLVIRALTIQDIGSRNVLSVTLKELRLGLVMGIFLGLLAFGRAWVSTDQYGVILGMVVTASVVAVMALSTVTGALLPIFFKLLGFDPAVMSSPFIATIIDIVTITLYYSISVAMYLSFVVPIG